MSQGQLAEKKARLDQIVRETARAITQHEKASKQHRLAREVLDQLRRTHYLADIREAAGLVPAQRDRRPSAKAVEERESHELERRLKEETLEQFLARTHQTGKLPAAPAKPTIAQTDIDFVTACLRGEGAEGASARRELRKAAKAVNEKIFRWRRDNAVDVVEE